MSPRPLHVLTVEPDTALGRAAAEALQRAGHSTTTVGSAEEALDCVGPEPDVLVAELRLPGMSGLDLLATLGDQGLAPRAVFCAALPTYNDCRRAWKLGAVDVLAKPLDLDELVRVVSSGHSSPGVVGEVDRLDLEGDATVRSIEAAVRETLAFALRVGCAPAARARLGGAVHEALDNVRRHAHGGEIGSFRLHARRADGRLEVHVRDEGTGFDSVRARVEAVGAASEPLGGLARMASLVEGLAIESSQHGTRVTLRVGTRPTTFDAGASTDLSELDHLDPFTARSVLRAIGAGEPVDLFNVPPALAVVIGRLLSGPTQDQVAQTSLWS